MKGCLTAIGVFVGAVVLVAFFYVWISFYDVEVHCRITIEVQDGDQIKTGSGVIGLLYNINPEWADFDHFNNASEQRGYALTVDLGNKGLLVLTFGHAPRTPQQQAARNKDVDCQFDDIGCLPFAAYRVSGGSANMDAKRSALGELQQQRGAREVPFAALPNLDRIAVDHQSLEHVEPDGLAARFGPGVVLKRVVLELTNDRVTPQPAIWPQWIAADPELLGTLWGVYK